MTDAPHASQGQSFRGSPSEGLKSVCVYCASSNAADPAFLTGREMLYDQVETLVVQSMHERKQIMFEQSDAFAVLPGGIGTLEEIVELMSWRRLDLHQKPMVFYSPGGFWDPLFKLMDHTIDQNLTPSWFRGTYRSVADIEAVLPAIRQMMPAGPQRDPKEFV